MIKDLNDNFYGNIFVVVIRIQVYLQEKYYAFFSLDAAEFGHIEEMALNTTQMNTTHKQTHIPRRELLCRRKKRRLIYKMIAHNNIDFNAYHFVIQIEMKQSHISIF